MYEIRAYYDSDFRGLSASETADNRDQMIEIVHDLASRGGFFCVENTETGEEIRFSADTYENEYFYEGEVNLPIS